MQNQRLRKSDCSILRKPLAAALAGVLCLLFLFTKASWAVDVNTFAAFKTNMESNANVTINITGNFAMTDHVVVPSGYTKTVRGWNSSTNAATARTITKIYVITVKGTLSLSKLTFDGSGVVNGGIYVPGKCTMTDCTIQNVAMTNSSAVIGNSGTLTMTNCTVKNCYVNSNNLFERNCISNAIGATMTMNNCTIDSFTKALGDARKEAQAIMNRGTLTLNNCTIKNNKNNSTYINEISAIYSRNAFNTGSANIAPKLTLQGTNYIIDNDSHGSGCAGIHSDGDLVFADGSHTIFRGNKSYSAPLSIITHPAITTQGSDSYVAKVTMGNTAKITAENNIGGGVALTGYGNLKPTLRNITAYNNETAMFNQSHNIDLASNGGGIRIHTEYGVTLIDCTVGASGKGNRANYGGGIYIWGPATLTNCNCSYNTATNDGGGMSLWNADVTLQNVVINNNTAAESGGGIFCTVGATGTVNKLSCTGTYTLTMSGNKATNGDGGAIYCPYAYGGGVGVGTLTLSGTGAKTFTKNTAGGAGGAIYISNGTLADITVGGSAANKNTAAYGGGVAVARSIYSPNDAKVTISGGTYTYNTATEEGGGFLLRLGVSNGNDITVTFSNSPTVRYNSAKNGGGIYTNTNVTLPAMTITNNTASDNGGGVYVPAKTTLTLQNPTINNNTATSNGGGIYNLGTVSCTDSYALTMTGNKATNSDGGAIWNQGTLTLTSTGAKSFSNNTAGASGGAIITYGDNSAMTLNNGTFSFTNNTAGTYGGGVYTNKAINMSDASSVTFTGNTAGTTGGGIHATGAAVTLSGTANTFTNNKAGQTVAGNGGGVFCAGLTCAGTLTMTGNEAGTASLTGHGGGIYSSGAVNLTGTTTKTINTNKAVSGNGGAIWTSGGGTLTSCTVGASGKANTAKNGGGVFLHAGTLTVSGGSCTYNTASVNGGGYYIQSGTANLSNNYTVSNNEAFSLGGGAYINTGATMQLNGTGTNGVKLQNNKAVTHGGGVYKLGSLKVQGLIVITDNTSGGD